MGKNTLKKRRQNRVHDRYTYDIPGISPIFIDPSEYIAAKVGKTYKQEVCTRYARVRNNNNNSTSIKLIKMNIELKNFTNYIPRLLAN